MWNQKLRELRRLEREVNCNDFVRHHQKVRVGGSGIQVSQ